MDFNDFRHDYTRHVEEAVGFSRLSHDFFLRAKARHLVELATRRVGDPAALVALDVGCGTGLMARLLVPSFRLLWGVDVSAGMIREAAKSVPDARFAAFDGSVLPFPDGSFDLAFAVCVLHHVPPSCWRPFVIEMSRIVRKGGLVVLLEHNPFNPITRFAVSRCAFDRDAVLLRAGSARRLMRDAGLQQLERVYILLFPSGARPWSGIERALGRIPLGAQYIVSGTASGAAQGPGGTAPIRPGARRLEERR